MRWFAVCISYEQMILEKRASRQMARKAHQKQKAEEKPGRDVGENGQDRANVNDTECKKADRKEREGDGEKKSLQHYKDQPGAGSVAAKPVSIQDQTQVAVGRRSPAANVSMTKTSYNPITHVSSESCFIVQLIHRLHSPFLVHIEY